MPRAPEEIRSLARKHTTKAVQTLVQIMSQPKAAPAARIQAATALLDRGWGKPANVVQGDENGGPVVVTWLKDE